MIDVDVVDAVDSVVDAGVFNVVVDGNVAVDVDGVGAVVVDKDVGVGGVAVDGVVTAVEVDILVVDGVVVDNVVVEDVDVGGLVVEDGSKYKTQKVFTITISKENKIIFIL